MENQNTVGQAPAQEVPSRVPAQTWIPILALAASVGILMWNISSSISDVRSDIGNLRTELKEDIGDLRTEVTRDTGDVRTELTRDVLDNRAGLRILNYRLSVLEGTEQASDR